MNFNRYQESDQFLGLDYFSKAEIKARSKASRQKYNNGMLRFSQPDIW